MKTLLLSFLFSVSCPLCDTIYANGFEDPVKKSPTIVRIESGYPGRYYGPQSSMGGFDRPFGQLNSNWMTYAAYNKTDVTGRISEISVRCWKFVAPPNTTVGLKNSSTSGTVAMSVGSTCGHYDGLPSRCRTTTGGSININTKAPSTIRCNLIPGQTYYFNQSYFNLAIYLQDKTIVGSCPPSTPRTTRWCIAEHATVAIP